MKKRVLKYINDHPGCELVELGRLNIQFGQLARILTELRKEGLIRKVTYGKSIQFYLL